MPDLRLRPLHWITALLFALIQGCATAPTPEAGLPPIALPDGNWEIVAASFAQTGRVPGAPRATLAFQNGRISANSGCNSASAAVRGVAGRLEVEKLAATRRACPEPLGWFESRFFGLLKAGPLYRVDGDALVLVAGDNNARFRRVAGR